MDKEKILIKHLKTMLKRTKQSYVTVDQMKETPEYKAVLSAMNEMEDEIIKKIKHISFKIIDSEDEYIRYTERLDEIIDAEIGTPEGDELDILCLLIEKYEEKHYPIPV